MVADGQLCSAPSMAWGQLRLLAGVAEQRERRGRRRAGRGGASGGWWRGGCCALRRALLASSAGSGGEAAVLCWTTGSAASTGDGTGQAGTSGAVSIPARGARGGEARVRRVGLRGVCRQRAGRRKKKEKEGKKEKKKKGKRRRRKEERVERERERAAVGGIRGDGREHATALAERDARETRRTER